MKWKFYIYDHPEFIRIVATGEFDGAGTIAMFNELFTLPDWDLRVPILLDTREMVPLNATTMELMDASVRIQDLGPRLAFTKIAVILRSPEILEKAEQIEQIAAGGQGAETRMFLDEQEALAWLVPNYTGAEPKAAKA